jgi:hypothetical protein
MPAPAASPAPAAVPAPASRDAGAPEVASPDVASALPPAPSSQPQDAGTPAREPAAPSAPAESSLPGNTATSADDPIGTDQTAPRQAESAHLAQQIAAHPHLPKAVRQALAELVSRRGQLAQGAVQLPVTDLVSVLVQTLPAFLRRDAQAMAVAEHPTGDAFFEGLAGELSEAQAERLARAQLAASGWLKGQSARDVL